jgi:hypothetical protein
MHIVVLRASVTREPDTDTPPTIGPFQLALRFALELGALFSIAAWARRAVGTGALGWCAAIGVVVLVASLWGVFAVPGDPSRSGRAPVPVSGWTRIGIEMAVFLAGAASLASLQWWHWFDPFIAALVIHHVGTRKRIVWLVR